MGGREKEKKEEGSMRVGRRYVGSRKAGFCYLQDTPT